MEVYSLLIDSHANPTGVKMATVNEDNPKSIYKVLKCTSIAILKLKIGGREFAVVCDDEALTKTPVPPESIRSEDGEFHLFGNVLVCNEYKGRLITMSKGDSDYIKSHIISVSTSKFGRTQKPFKVQSILIVDNV